MSRDVREITGWILDESLLGEIRIFLGCLQMDTHN